MLVKESQSLISNRSYWPLAFLYGLFGLTSVAYEVLWARMLSLQFGVSIFAVVLTVAAFMGGLGAGSLFAARRASQIKRPLLLLAALEGGIVVFALVLPLILQMTSAGMENAAAQLSLFQWYGLIASVALCLLLFPAFIMGAGFPLILASLGNMPERLGKIYGLNTLGAACGALLPLWLLPSLGWVWSVRVVAAIGCLCVIALLLLSPRYGTVQVAENKVSASRPRFTFLFAYAGIGAASLILQIAWTRLFGMVMLRTEYVLSVILASFLLGIGIGSLIAPRQHRQVWFVILPIAAGGFSILSLWLLPALSAWVERTEFTSLFEALSMQGLLLTLVTLPVTLALGAWLPLLNSRSNGGGVWLYGANSLGAALGAVVAGVVLIPVWGSSGTVVMAASVLLILGLTWAQSRAAWLAVPFFLMAAWPVIKLPSVSALMPQAHAGSRDLYFYEDAISMTHVVEQQNGQRVLLTDLQRMDASTDPTAVFVQSNQARLPLLLHEQPRSVLFLGLGTGISVAGSLAFPDLDRSAVELSQGAINSAGTWFTPLNRNALRQAKVERDDVRHFLSASRDQYDVIIGDVFHPDLAGSSSLLSVQQFQRVHNRLSENGLFVQWLALNQFDNKSLNVIFNSFKLAFPDAQLFLDGMHLALVGPRQEFMGAQGLLHNLQRMSLEQQNEATASEGGWTWLGRYWGPLPGNRGQVQDEWSPVIEFHLPRARYAGKLDVANLLQTLLNTRPKVEVAANFLGILDSDIDAFERAYIGSELITRSWLAAARGATQQANQLTHLAHKANAKDRWIAYALADMMFLSLVQAREHGLSEKEALQKILHLNPYHVEAVRALWRIERKAGDARAEVSRAHLLELSPLDLEANMSRN
ncbi:fused MFS/spermidine synthase [Candidatus Nitrotoga sp. M5]|uniref:fused MFS/spermidine synthase n=1 Tax=Candidatus Nitrotoga sp. M5 TaxID=2890409 RepID=UPI001EF48C37|nr:fused MFS/spermidine synthase [Candidatus Nitrotoga sp. M5]CAH1388129.1 Spermidine synthase [Candidatus Nitrotoga sp. M5]